MPESTATEMARKAGASKITSLFKFLFFNSGLKLSHINEKRKLQFKNMSSKASLFGGVKLNIIS